MVQSRKYRVLFISSWYPTRISMTNGDFIQRHALAVSSIHDVVFLHVQYDKFQKEREQIHYNSKDNFREVIIYFNVNLNLFKPLFYFWYYLKGFHIIRELYGNPDLIHANVIFPIGFIALFLKFRYRLNYIISEHWSIYLSNSSRKVGFVQKVFDKMVVRNAFAVCPVTENLADSIKSHGYKGRFIVVPNVVNVESFNFSCTDKKVKKHFLHVSSLQNASKNISGLLHAIKMLTEIRRDFVLNLVGGDELEEHKTLAKELKIIDNYVIFHGEQPHEKIAEYMQQNNFFVLFSNYESLPCVIIEAMACGLPIISTNVGGIKEHVSEFNGILISPKDEQSLVKAINNMLDNSDTYNRERIREYAIKTFSEEAIASDFNSIYNQMTGNV